MLEKKIRCGECGSVFYSRQEVKNLCPYCGEIIHLIGSEEVNLGSRISSVESRSRKGRGPRKDKRAPLC